MDRRRKLAARSQGVELSLTLKPASATTISGWIAYDDATLTQNFPAAAGLLAFKGDRLPYSAKWSGNVSFNQDFAVTDRIGAYTSGTLSYVGNRQGAFFSPTIGLLFGGTERATFPSYWQLDLTAGLKFEQWRANVFLTNATNERGVLRTGADSFLPTFVTYRRPRSYGLTVSRSF